MRHGSHAVTDGGSVTRAVCHTQVKSTVKSCLYKSTRIESHYNQLEEEKKNNGSEGGESGTWIKMQPVLAEQMMRGKSEAKT